MVSRIDATALRRQFPFRRNHEHLVYLDSAATTQIPDCVLEQMNTFETTSRANIHRGIYSLAEQSTETYEQARNTIASFFNADPTEIIFTHGATDALNIAIQGWGEPNLNRGDLVLIETANHHANIVPWQMLAAHKGIRLAFIDSTEEGTIDETHWHQLLEQHPKAVALTHTSNVTGLTCDLKRLALEAHTAGAVVFADCAQSAGHMICDFSDFGIDFAAVSAHKMYGPFGIGVLYLSKRVAPYTDPPFGGGGMIEEVTVKGFKRLDPPHGFEAGTPNITGAIGFAAACDFLSTIGLANCEAQSSELCDQTLDVLAAYPDIIVLGSTQPDSHTSIVSFFMDSIHPHDIASAFDDNGIAVRAGHHCAMPLHKALRKPASVRVSFGVYSTSQDVDRLAQTLSETRRRFS